MKTPGVYIVEKDAFPNSVVEVPTAVPAFIGYTASAGDKETSLANKPRRITSLTDFEQHFGGAPDLTKAFSLSSAEEGQEPLVRLAAHGDQEGHDYVLTRITRPYYLYYSVKSFYQNGGGPCFIVSVGSYDDVVEKDALIGGLEPLVKEQEPTMVVIPDAVLLETETDCEAVQRQALKHCAELRSRFAILDVRNGFRARDEGERDCVADFRERLGDNDLQWGAAYYPWIDTSLNSRSELSYEHFDEEGRKVLAEILEQESKPQSVVPETTASKKALDTWTDQIAPQLDLLRGSAPDGASLTTDEKVLLDKTLVSLSPVYKDVLDAVLSRLNLFPPSGTLAGVHAKVDNTRGVWKAPANVSLNGVVKPTVNISHADQEDLNVGPQGKSINAIRSFVREGTLVWGARTLDGNSLDWRYISVRRTMIMLEQSLKLAAKAYVFEANDANTWITIKSMIRNFLMGIWNRGGLAGSAPEDAFSVHVGLGETMTPEDMLEGILRVTILVAPTRPAEFIEITFTQQMQESEPHPDSPVGLGALKTGSEPLSGSE